MFHAVRRHAHIAERHIGSRLAPTNAYKTVSLDQKTGLKPIVRLFMNAGTGQGLQVFQ